MHVFSFNLGRVRKYVDHETYLVLRIIQGFLIWMGRGKG